MKVSIFLPKGAEFVINTLLANGKAAYAVGGFVRDSLIGNTPGDCDIATSATPNEVENIFSDLGCTVVPTGEKHGTVTVVFSGVPHEVTTFRRDGAYADSRHPESVSFTDSIEEDLARRDFTVNAMALSADGELIDLFGGRDDLENRIIRTVGEPRKRFSEDALRILRAVRFSSVLGFEIDPATAKAATEMSSKLRDISAERVYAELDKFLCGRDAGRVLQEYHGVICAVIPELSAQVGFDQKNPHHCYDLLTHTAKVLDGVPANTVMRFSALLHDIAKPTCFTEDEHGGHIYGHEKEGAKKAAEILGRLKAPNSVTEKVTALVSEHGLVLLENEGFVRRCLNRFGEETFRNLIALSLSDNSALSSICDGRTDTIKRVLEIAERLIAEKACFSLSDLAVDGRDLIGIGIEEGPRLGMILNLLLGFVMDGQLENNRDVLLAEASKYVIIR